VDSTAPDRFDTSRFEASRNRLASLAYRLLGSAADAEDAVQDAFLRWQGVDRQLITVAEAWLTKVVTNLCLDRLRSAQARRERAVGAWLPEPLLDGDPMLGPARLRITAGRRRGGEVDPASARGIVEEFLAAASSGRTERLVALLTDDATAISDGAGLTETLLRYDTPQRIAAIARAGFTPTSAKRRFAGGTPAIHYALVNGDPAILFVLGDQVVGAVGFGIAGGKIATVHGIAAPTRLTRLAEAWRQHDPDTPLITHW
jgi:DNA-directed RNA polymerase specialized sigma24 family protein